MVDVGSRFDTFDNSGAANLLAQLSLKGTTARPGDTLLQEANSAGISLQATVGRELTSFQAKCLRSNTPLAVTLLADAIQNSALSTEAVAMGKVAALKSIAALESNQEQANMDNLHATAFDGTTLALPVIGSEPTVAQLTGIELKSFKNAHYTPNRMVVAAAGDITHEELVKVHHRPCSL